MVMTRWWYSYYPLLFVVCCLLLSAAAASTAAASTAAAASSSSVVDQQGGVNILVEAVGGASPVCDSAEAAASAAAAAAAGNGTGGATATTTTTTEGGDGGDVDILLQAALGQIPWLEGRVGKSSQLPGYWNHDKIMLRRQDPQNPEKSSIGVFATNGIDEGELLVRIPSSAIITGTIPPSSTDDDGEDVNDHTDHNSKEHWLNCNVINKLAKILMKQQHVNMGRINDIDIDFDDLNEAAADEEEHEDDDDDEDYSGYANYLLHQPVGQIPSDWS